LLAEATADTCRTWARLKRPATEWRRLHTWRHRAAKAGLLLLLLLLLARLVVTLSDPLLLSTTAFIVFLLCAQLLHPTLMLHLTFAFTLLLLMVLVLLLLLMLHLHNPVLLVLHAPLLLLISLFPHPPLLFLLHHPLLTLACPVLLALVLRLQGERLLGSDNIVATMGALMHAWKPITNRVAV
jgi:hypothetical protein